ncbi:MAG TPA: ABC transporter permease, partial [Gammaproteobacteria bacterium]|nr:ABC transporter permease [Gammaproteobacteria bacterium]
MLLGLVAPSILIIIAVIMIPLGWLFYLSLIGKGGEFSMVNYQKMIEYKSYARVYLTTFEVSILTTLVCI